MKPIIFVEEKISQDYKSPLFELFSSELQDKISLSSSFLEYSDNCFPIFTNVNPFIVKFVETKKIKEYGLILDSDILNKISDVKLLSNAKFVYFIGELPKEYREFIKKIKASHFDRILMSHTRTQEKYIICESSCMQKLYEDVISQKVLLSTNDKIYIIKDTNQALQNPFAILNIGVEYVCPTPAMLKILLSTYKLLYFKSKLFDSYLNNAGNCISVDEFYSSLQNNLPMRESSKGKKITVNVICFKPTYLFADLVNRFVSIGCVHSDFPLPDADAYIWMRPQEIWHYEYLLRGAKDPEIKQSYVDGFKNLDKKCNFFELQKKSIAIHHGTCFKPLYQFCPIKLANALYKVNKVIGVCEFEECYGPVAQRANRNNYSFFPIGYDHKIFNEAYVRREKRQPNSMIKIGVVGRLYGTSDEKLLSTSMLAEPYGYRKGSDLILDVSLRLKAQGIPFELHVLGGNWEEFVQLVDNYHIPIKYHQRDKDIAYKEYPKIYSEFDVLFIASRCEGGPVSAIEALSLGVPVVSSNVGICRFLEKTVEIKGAVSCFDYDRKWGVFDKEKALNLLVNIYNSAITFEDRSKIRNCIKAYTTDTWVDFIFNEAIKLTG